MLAMSEVVGNGEKIEIDGDTANNGKEMHQLCLKSKI